MGLCVNFRRHIVSFLYAPPRGETTRRRQWHAASHWTLLAETMPNCIAVSQDNVDHRESMLGKARHGRMTRRERTAQDRGLAGIRILLVRGLMGGRSGES